MAPRSVHLHPLRLLTRLEARAPLLRPLTARLSRRRFDALAGRWEEIRSDASATDALLGAALAAAGVTAPARVLDVGTGTGQAVRFLRRAFPEAQIDAIDAAPAMIARAQTLPGAEGVHFVVADAAALPYAAGTFDLVTGLCVPPFPRELARVLAPGGSVLLAYAHGPQTPIWTPPAELARRLRAAGLGGILQGRVGAGEWTAARAD